MGITRTCATREGEKMRGNMLKIQGLREENRGKVQKNAKKFEIVIDVCGNFVYHLPAFTSLVTL